MITVIIPVHNILKKEIEMSVNEWKKQSPKKVIVVKNKTKDFSNSLCRNIGLKKSNTKYTLFVDVDVLPDKELLQIANGEMDDNTVLMCSRMDGNDEHFAPGSFQLFPTKWLKRVGGYDEQYTGWGFFDMDIVERAKKDGLEIKWIKGKLYHQDHSPREYKNEAEINRNREIYNKKWGK